MSFSPLHRYILIVTFLADGKTRDSKLNDGKHSWDVICFVNPTFVTVTPKYLNFVTLSEDSLGVL
jgi:hypothetical protein